MALLIDRDYGLLRWAPVFALVFVGLWFTYRSRRELLARAVPQLREMERAATMCAAAVAAQLLTAAFLAPTLYGPWFPPRYLVAGLVLAVPLVALGLRHAPRTGIALALLSVVASVWLWLDVRLGGGGLVEPRPDAPFGPLTALLPRFDDSAWPYVLAAVIGAAVVARRGAGATAQLRPRSAGARGLHGLLGHLLQHQVGALAGALGVAGVGRAACRRPGSACSGGRTCSTSS